MSNMKTEPTEALKTLIQCVFDAYDIEGEDVENIVRYDMAKDTAIKSFKEGQSNPKIKPLEWESRFVFTEELGIKAQTPFGTYTIIDMEDSGFAEGIYLSRIDDEHVEVSSFDEGKKLAQEDFEQRVKECLIIE